MPLSDSRFATTCSDGHMQVLYAGTSCITHLTTWYPRSSWPSVPIIPSIPSTNVGKFNIFHNFSTSHSPWAQVWNLPQQDGTDMQLPMILTNRVGRRGLLTKLGKGSGKIITHTKTCVSIVDPDNIFIKVVRVCARARACARVRARACACVRVRACACACVRARACACVCRGSGISTFKANSQQPYPSTPTNYSTRVSR